MINFILYEDSKVARESYKKVIFKLIGSNKQIYQIFEFDKYDQKTEEALNNIDGKKIYLLDVEVPGKNGIDLAREIRNNNDWDSQIILITSHEEFRSFTYLSKLLMLDFISKMDDVKTKLYETLALALNIVSIKKALSFSNKNGSYQVPYDDILYIEKEVNDNNCKIVTANKTYVTRDTINHLDQELKNDYRFFKTHRGCIVNLNNITSVNYNNNIIYFGNKEIGLLARDKRKELKEKLKI